LRKYLVRRGRRVLEDIFVRIDSGIIERTRDG
jgi:hypothetical protein